MRQIPRAARRLPPGTIRALAVRGALLASAWVVLTGGSPAYWGLATLIVVAAAATSLAVMPPGQWRWTVTGLARFLPFFARQSVLGGVDVSRRVFRPSIPVDPGLVEFRLRLPAGPPRVFFANSVSLQPGTASVGLEGDVLIVHALDRSMPVEESLRALEVRVADLFGVELAQGHDTTAPSTMS